MQRNFFHMLGLLVIALACLWPAGFLGFIGYDDIDYVYQNPVVQSGLNGNSVQWAFVGAHAGNWHPITWLSHMLDCELFGLNPQEEHWVNLGFHAANTLLIFVWLWELTGARWRSFLVAAFFAVHPLHVQSVAWISERKDVLSGFFFLATLLGYTRYCRNCSRMNYAWILILFALGLMAKPMLVTTPLVLLLLDFWPLARCPVGPHSNLNLSARISLWRPLVVEKIPLIVLSAISCLITLWAQKTGGAVASIQQFSLLDRCLHTAVAYGLYLGKLFYPVDLAILYPLQHSSPDVLTVLGSALLLVALFTAVLWRRKAQPYLLMGWAWFFIMLLPVIGLVQVGYQAIADRYTYLPSIGLFIAVVWSLAEIAARSPLWRAGMVGLSAASLLACGLDTRYQLGFWKDNITLFQHVLKVSPENNFLGNFYLGISYGDLGQLDSAASCLTAALAANPGFELARNRLGNVLLVQKKYAAAEPYLEAEAKARPDNFISRVTYGIALAGQGKYTAAQSEYQAAQRINPNNTTVNQLLAAIAPKADAELTLTTLTNLPGSNFTAETHARIAMAQNILGHYSEAIKQYKLALAKKPDSAEFLNNLAWALATCPDDAVRDGTLAVSLAKQACDQTQYKKTVYIGTLAAAYAETGQFEAAVLNANRACDNASAQGETGLLEINQKLLGLYQNRQAYHEPFNLP